MIASVPFPNPDTQFKPGQSGNPGGRSPSLRGLIRRAMSKPAGDGATALEKWVEDLLLSEDNKSLVLDLLRHADGATPAEDPTEHEDDRDRKPQIVIPAIAPLNEGGQPIEGGA